MCMWMRVCKNGASDKHTSHARRVCEQISRHACAISIIESGCREPVCKATEKPADRLCPTFLPSLFPPLPVYRRRTRDPSATPAITSAECEIRGWCPARPDCEWSANGWLRELSLSNYEAPPIRTRSCNFHLIPYNGYTRVARWRVRWKCYAVQIPSFIVNGEMIALLDEDSLNQSFAFNTDVIKNNDSNNLYCAIWYTKLWATQKRALIATDNEMTAISWFSTHTYGKISK